MIDWHICRGAAAQQKDDAEQHMSQLQQQHTTLLAAATAEGSSIAQLLDLQSQVTAAKELCKKVGWTTCCSHTVCALHVVIYHKSLLTPLTLLPDDQQHQPGFAPDLSYGNLQSTQ